MAKALVAVAVMMFVLSGAAAAQGGKAEPRRIEFVAGKSAATLAGTLSNGQEMEYVVRASAGQALTIRNSKTSLFDVRVFSEEADVETEFDSSPVFSVDLPKSGDYIVYVRKKQVRSPRTARFSVILQIK